MRYLCHQLEKPNAINVHFGDGLSLGIWCFTLNTHHISRNMISLLVSTLWKILVRWDDYSQYMKKKIQTTNQILFAMIYTHYNLIKRSLVRKLPSYGRMSLASRATEALDHRPWISYSHCIVTAFFRNCRPCTAA